MIRRSRTISDHAAHIPSPFILTYAAFEYMVSLCMSQQAASKREQGTLPIRVIDELELIER
jgi:hypothetical protein